MTWEPEKTKKRLATAPPVVVSGSGSSTLPIVVYGMVRKTIEPSINAISTIILVVTALLIYLADRLIRVEPGRTAGETDTRLVIG